MKESKLSRELTLVIVALAFIYIVIIFVSTFFIQNFYVDMKFERLQSFFEENRTTLTEQELIEYAENQGFTHTVQSFSNLHKEAVDSLFDGEANFSDYSQYLEAFNRLAGNREDRQEGEFEANFDTKTESVNFFTQDKLITLSLNSSITKDIVYVTILIASFTTFLFIAMIICVNSFITRRVGRPLDKLSKYIDDIANLSSTQELQFTHDDEIKKIGMALMSMENDLNKEIVNRNELLRAITHELKTPLAHIITLLYLHRNQVDEYANFDFIEEQIQNIINENNELIQITLNSLESTDKLKQDINVKALIESKIKTFDVYLTNKQVTVDVDNFEIETNPVPINLIINNLLLNASKYSNTFLHVSASDMIIKIENDYVDNAGNGVGKTIINRLSEFENFQIDVKQEDGIYTTYINLSS